MSRQWAMIPIFSIMIDYHKLITPLIYNNKLTVQSHNLALPPQTAKR